MPLTLIFFLDRGHAEHVPQAQYAELLGGVRRLPQHAGREVRVADWYVDAPDGTQPTVLNETYSILQLDAAGNVDWSRCRIGGRGNRELYEALRSSSFDDPEDDPVVQRVRARVCDEVTWLPDKAERRRLEAAALKALRREDGGQ